MALDYCPLCETRDEDGTYFDVDVVECQKCGYYQIYYSAIECPDWNRVKKYMIAGAIRQANLTKNKISITSENLTALESFCPSDPIERMDRFLLNIALMAEDSVTPVQLDANNDYPLSFSKSVSDHGYIVNFLHADEVFSNLKSLKSGQVLLSSKGWERVRQLRNTISSNSKQAFIAMNFDDDCDPIYKEGIEQSIRETGYEPMNLKFFEHIGRIDDRIIAEIRKSRFIIAEFTGHKHGVYFEAGFATGLGIPVIWCCKESDFDEAHFDTSHFSHILWKTYSDLKKQLIDRIEAVIV